MPFLERKDGTILQGLAWRVEWVKGREQREGLANEILEEVDERKLRKEEMKFSMMSLLVTT